MIRYPTLLVCLALSPLAVPATAVLGQNGACLTGAFQDAKFRVFEQDRFVAVEMPGQIAIEFRAPTPDGRWASVLIDRVSVMLERDNSGEVTTLKWQDGDSVYVLARATATTDGAVDVASLARYTGRWMDLRHVGRGLLKTTDLTLVSLLMLAVGIGAITTVFSTVYAVFLRPPGGAEGAVNLAVIART